MVMRNNRSIGSGRRRAVIAALAALGVGAGLLSMPAGADPGEPADGDDPVLEPAPGPGAAVEAAETAAMDAARMSGEPVEVAELTTERERVVADPESGSFTAEVTPFPTRVMDEHSGSWVDVDPTLELGADGAVQPVATSVDLEFSRGGTSPLARISDGDQWVELGWPGVLPTPVLDGETATYPEVYPGVDLVLRAGAEEFNQFLVVKSPEAARNPALAEVRFPVRTSPGLELTPDHDDATGGLLALDTGGEPVFAVPEPRMWDSNGLHVSSDGTVTFGSREGAPLTDVISEGPEARSATMDMEVAGDVLTVVPDLELLTSADAVFPIVIDPTVSRYHTYWRMVWSNGTSFANSYTGDVRVGYNGWESPLFRSRVFYRFDVSTFANREIVSARFLHRQVHSPPWKCGGTHGSAVEIARTGPIDSSTSWSNQPSGSSSTYATTARSHGHRNYCSGYTTTEWNATAAVRYEASRGNTRLTIRMRSTNESDREGWRQFRNVSSSAPRLQVTYNRPPRTPTGMRTTSPTTTCESSSSRPWVNDNSPVLRATLSSPDSQNLRGRFERQRDTGSGFGSTSTSTTSYGAQGERSVSLSGLGDGRWRWRVRAEDTATVSSFSQWCYFQLKTTPPPAPTVSISEPYQFDTWTQAGPLPQATLTVGRSGDTSVDRFRYSIGSSTPTTTATMSSTGTVTFTPTYGVTTISVRLLDRAGNLGPISVYTLKIVTPPALHAWLMNEGSGTAAADLARPAGQSMALSLGSGVTWDAGNRAEMSGEMWDHALRFDGTGPGAVASGPAVFPLESFTVTARVKIDQLDPGSAQFVAVSQDGELNSVFKLGYNPTVERWAAWMPSTDGPSPTWTRVSGAARPKDEVGPGGLPFPDGQPDWQHLALVYDAAAGQVRLFVDGDLEATGSFTFTWTADSPLRVGRGLTNGSLTGTASGLVDDVVVFDVPLSAPQIRLLESSDSADEIEAARDAILDETQGEPLTPAGRP